MKFSFNELHHFVDLKAFKFHPEKLMSKIHQAGFEVDQWEKKYFAHLKVVTIKTKKLHPGADRLYLVQVESDKDRLHSIVCGADNFKQGDKAVLALPGAVLPENFKIKARTVRGENSEGMLVSLGELGIQTLCEEEKGILTLPPATMVKGGVDFAEHFGLNDIILDIDITPNRADCLSHFGMAREISCILNQSLKQDVDDNKSSLLSASVSSHPSIRNRLTVEVKQPDLCPRYTGRAVYGVSVKPSPLWLRIFLHNLGLKSINNIVDATNYFLRVWGQPLHAFDLDRLNKKIVVAFPPQKEKFKTLDQEEILLKGDELCIRDDTKTLALAGVIGGTDSGINSNTQNIFLESASFDPSHVRKNSKFFNIETDSSYLFSRGVPEFSVLKIRNKALKLIQNLAGGQISRDEYDYRESVKDIPSIQIGEEDIKRRLGMEVNFSRFKNWMTRLSCEVKELRKSVVIVKPPFFRPDLHIKEDLIEEYARLEGYDKIPEVLIHLSNSPKSDPEEYTGLLNISQILTHVGFYQAINHSFISQEFSDSFLNYDKDYPLFLWSYLAESPCAIKAIFLKNPLSSEYNMMRVSLLPSLFKNALISWRHGCSYGRLAEVGKVFSSHSSQSRETFALALLAWGQKDNIWEKHKQRPCVYDLKATIQTLLDRLNIQNYSWEELKKAPAFFHPYQYQVLKIKETVIGYMGSLNPLYQEKYKIKAPMALAEIQPYWLLKKKETKKKFQNLSPFPAVERDLSFLMPKDFPAGKIIKEIKKQAGALCRHLEVFDIYKDTNNIDKNSRSVSFRLLLQSDKKTLTEKEIKKLHDKILNSLSAYPITLRK